MRATGLSLLAVMVLVLVGWATSADSQASATSAVAAGFLVWLVAQGASVEIPGGTFSLMPMGLTALPVTLLWLATRRVVRQTRVRDVRGSVALVSAIAATYAVLSVLVGVLVRIGDLRVPLVPAFFAVGGLAAAVATASTLHASGRWALVWHRFPALLRRTFPGALGALATLVGGGALLTGVALLRDWSQASALVSGLDPGLGGAVLLALGCLAALPNAVAFAVAFATGPGFAVGAGTSVTMNGAQLGAVPAVPLLAALPSGSSAGAGALAAVVPVAAGIVAALLVRRQTAVPKVDVPEGYVGDLRAAATVGGMTGAALAAFVALSAGSAGPGRLSDVGPVWWLVGPAAAVEVAVVTALVLALLRRRV